MAKRKKLAVPGPPQVPGPNKRRLTKILVLKDGVSPQVDNAINLLINAAYYLQWPLAVGGRWPRETVLDIPESGFVSETTDGGSFTPMGLDPSNGDGDDYPSDDERPPSLVPGMCDPNAVDLQSQITVEDLVWYGVWAMCEIKAAITLLGGTLTLPK